MERTITNETNILINSVNLKRLINTNKKTAEMVIGEVQAKGIPFSYSTYTQRFLTNKYSGEHFDEICEVFASALNCKVEEFTFPIEEDGPEAA